MRWHFSLIDPWTFSFFKRSDEYVQVCPKVSAATENTTDLLEGSSRIAKLPLQPALTGEPAALICIAHKIHSAGIPLIYIGGTPNRRHAHTVEFGPGQANK